ncbi:MAG: alpha/beta fold hydrolase [Lewinellaceae bacterium]|nr:alpha/beta fold hydrolase [Saprospiraceae bacterium]MCB9333614.1 alpha/beta fold hydrolase [Lewinellaceae bacterium]
MELFAREFGQGDPIVILHGLFGFSDNWQTVAKALADHHLVITPDLRNHGRSPHLPSHTYPEMAEDLKAFLEHHWIFSTVLIGHSMGGKVAMQFALEYPDMVDKLVVVDIAPGPASDNHSDIYEALLGLDLSRVNTRQEADDLLKKSIPEFGVRQFLLKNITRNTDGSYAWKMNLPVLWKAYPDILGGVSGPAFDKPVLFIRGSKSAYIKDSDFALIKSLFPQAEIATIEGAGHWVHADKPEALLAVLRQFLG